ncbi:hypothetical protein OC834_006013, partial [Tilletia horrida]
LKVFRGNMFNNIGPLRQDKEVDPSTPKGLDGFKVLDYALSWKLQSLRLSVAHQHTMTHLLIPRAPVADGQARPFETILYDTVAAHFGGNPKTQAKWCRRRVQGNEQPAIVYEVEQRLMGIVRERLPALITAYDHPGSQLFAKLYTSAETGEIEISIVGDVFRDVMISHLAALTEETCKGVPRIDLSAVRSYVAKWVDHVWLIDAIVPPSTVPIRVVLKTHQVPSDDQMTSELGTRLRPCIGEAERLATLPPHPHVLGAPLALIMIENNSVGRDVDVPKTANKTLLVGFLLPYLSGKLPFYDGIIKDNRFKTPADMVRRLRYGYEFASAIQFMHQQGIFIGDLKPTNLVLSAPPPHDRVVLIDLEPIEMYCNGIFANAPEGEGHWDASLQGGEDGMLIYTQCDAPVSRMLTIRQEWAHMPEALERLEVFGVGTTLSQLLSCSLCFPWLARLQLPFWIHRTDPNVPNKYIDQEWEARLPESFKTLIQRCCSFDPRDRPLLDEIVAELKQWA